MLQTPRANVLHLGTSLTRAMAPRRAALPLLAAAAAVQCSSPTAAHPLRRTTTAAVRGRALDGGDSGAAVFTTGGGPVMRDAVAFVIYYGSWTSGGGAVLEHVLRNMGGSPWMRIVTTYTDAVGPAGDALAFGGNVTDAYSQGTALTRAGVWAVVRGALDAGSLPTTPRGVYVVVASADVSEASFCGAACGWHGFEPYASNATAGNETVPIKFAFVGHAGRCPAACTPFGASAVTPNGDAALDAMASTLAHEVVEVVTNPEYPAGWANGAGEEGADVCAWSYGSDTYTAPGGGTANVAWGGRHFLIQRNLVLRQHDGGAEDDNEDDEDGDSSPSSGTRSAAGTASRSPAPLANRTASGRCAMSFSPRPRPTRAPTPAGTPTRSAGSSPSWTPTPAAQQSGDVPCADVATATLVLSGSSSRSATTPDLWLSPDSSAEEEGGDCERPEDEGEDGQPTSDNAIPRGPKHVVRVDIGGNVSTGGELTLSTCVPRLTSDGRTSLDSVVTAGYGWPLRRSTWRSAGADDDAPGCRLASRLTIPAVASRWVTVVVSGHAGTAQGAYALAARYVPPTPSRSPVSRTATVSRSRPASATRSRSRSKPASPSRSPPRTATRSRTPSKSRKVKQG